MQPYAAHPSHHHTRLHWRGVVREQHCRGICVKLDIRYGIWPHDVTYPRLLKLIKRASSNSSKKAY